VEPLEFKKRPNSLVPVPFFALGLLGLLSLNVGVAADPGAITFPPNPQGILLLHLAVLGWVTPVMMGADYQLIPVVLHRPIGGQRAATAVLAVYAAGVLAFLLGWGAGRPTWIAAGGAAAGWPCWASPPMPARRSCAARALGRPPWAWAAGCCSSS